MIATRSSAAYVDGFPLHHGSVALSFIGTVGFRASVPVERLPDPAALAHWLRLVAVLDAPPTVAVTNAEYRLAIVLREALARVAARVIDGRRPRDVDVATINERAADDFLAPQLRYRMTRGVGRLQGVAPTTVRAALGAIASDAIGVFAGSVAGSLVRCQLDECGAILLTDAGRATRKWCSTEKCANVSKVRAFRARKA